MKKFDLEDCVFQSNHLAEITASGLVEAEGSWLKSYKPHGTRVDVPLGEILFNNDEHTVPAYLLYGKENFRNRFGLDGSDEKPWILTLGLLLDGLGQLRAKDYQRYFKFVLNKSSDKDNEILMQYCIFGDKVFTSEGLIINTEEGGKDEEATEDKEAEQG